MTANQAAKPDETKAAQNTAQAEVANNTEKQEEGEEKPEEQSTIASIAVSAWEAIKGAVSPAKPAEVAQKEAALHNTTPGDPFAGTVTVGARPETQQPPKESGGWNPLKAIGDGAKWIGDAVGGAAKTVWDAASGAVNGVLGNVWKDEFGPEAQAKIEEKDGKVTKLTATDGVGRKSKTITSDGNTTTMTDAWGNTTTYDKATDSTVMTDKQGGKYTTDKATGDTTYESADGTKIIQRKNGTREFLDKSGRRIEQGDKSINIWTSRNLERFISDDGVVDTMKTYQEGVMKVFNHGDKPRESVAVEQRNAPGVHQFGDQTEKVETDGTRVIQGKDGRMRLGDCHDRREWEIKRDADGKPQLWRDGKQVKIDEMPERMQQRLQALLANSSEAKINGVNQIRLDDKGRLVSGDVTLSAQNGKIETTIKTGPAETDVRTYTNEADGKQTGPASEGEGRFVYDSNNKAEPYSEYNEKGDKIMTYNPESNRLWTPEYTSTPEGVQLSNGNFIHADGHVTNSEGKTMLVSGYSPNSPEYQAATGQVIAAVGNVNVVVGQAKTDPKGTSESAIEGAIGDLGKALAMCIKTGNYEQLNRIHGAIADAYGALATVKAFKMMEAQNQQREASLGDRVNLTDNTNGRVANPHDRVA